VTEKKPRKTRRHLAVALLFFLAVAILIVLAHMQPPLDLPVEEPPETVAKRLDRENNAWYVLLEARELLPDKPPLLEVKDEIGLTSHYKPEDSSLGQLLSVLRPDDDPLLLEYIEKSRPAMEYALQALKKPYFLTPPLTAGDGDAYFENLKTRHGLAHLPCLFLAESVRQPCCNEPDKDACENLLNAWRLLNVINDNSHHSGVLPFAIDVVKKASPAHRQRLAEWCKMCRAGWKPPLNSIDEALRMTYGAQANRLVPTKHVMPKIRGAILSVMLGREKKELRQIEPLVREAAGMTYKEYDRYRRGHPELDEFQSGMTSFRWEHYVYMNSASFATFDGVDIALALERFKDATGMYPDALETLVPEYLDELPKNPFTGEGYTYQLKGGEYGLTCTGGHRFGDRWQRPGYFRVYEPPGWNER